MKTSYFKKAQGYADAVSISLSKPYWSTVSRTYPLLAPTSEILSLYKDGKINEEEYTRMYTTQILGPLNPEKVYADLGPNAILCCWESSKRPFFCHRTIVARWLSEHLNIEITELG